MAVKQKTGRRAAKKKPTAVKANRDKSPFLQRLEIAMNKAGIASRPLSQQAGLSVSYVHDLFSGRTQRPSYEAMEAIAKVLEVSVAFLRGEDNHTPTQQTSKVAIEDMPVVGIVETGAFRSIMQTASEIIVARPTSTVHPQAKHFVYMVNDDAMSAAKEGPFLPGMELICVDLISADVEVETGKLYVIRRTLDGGRTYETILRRVMIKRGQTDLVTESARADWESFEKIVVPGRLGTDKRAEVFVVGLVVGTYREIK